MPLRRRIEFLRTIREFALWLTGCTPPTLPSDPISELHLSYLFLVSVGYLILRIVSSLITFLLGSTSLLFLLSNIGSFSFILLQSYCVRHKHISTRTSSRMLTFQAYLAAVLRLQEGFLRSAFSILPILPGVAFVISDRPFGFFMMFITAGTYFTKLYFALGTVESVEITIDTGLFLCANVVMMIFLWTALMLFLLAERDENLAMLSMTAQEAHKASDAKSIFIRSISHEFRTPLHAIIASCSFLFETQLDHQQKLFVETISSCSVNLKTLINNILDLSKSEASGLELVPVDFDLFLLIQDVANAITGLADSKNIEVITDIDLSHEMVHQYCHFDSNRLRQVLVNLVGNAIKFTSAGYIKISVQVLEIATEREKEETTAMIRFLVEDTGDGISPEFKSQLFLPFVKENRVQTEGTGLGLSISQTLVHLMGGKISVESEVGHGSTFFFDLQIPLCDRLRNASTQDPCSLISRRIQGLLHYPAHVLTVIDLPPLRESVVHPLMVLGLFVETKRTQEFQASLARRGVEALMNYQLILIDGVASLLQDVITILLQNPSFANSPSCPNILYFSTVPHIPLANQIFQRLQDPSKLVLITKPINIQAFLQTLQDVAAQRNLLGPPFTPPHPSTSAGQYNFRASTLLRCGLRPPEPIDQAGLRRITQESLSQIRRSSQDPAPTFSLPPPPTLQSPPSRAETHTNGFPSLNILVAEDNPINQMILNHFLQSKFKVHCQIASDGLQAIQMFEGFNFDIILMDLQMPILGGLEATRKIREIEQTQGRKRSFVVAITGLSSNADERDSMLAGCDVFLSKPVDMGSLEHILRSNFGEGGVKKLS